MCCNPAKGRVEFEDGWLIKSSFITKDEMKACQLTRTKIQQKKKKKKKKVTGDNLFSLNLKANTYTMAFTKLS
jgi:hypothetical protein